MASITADLQSGYAVTIRSGSGHTWRSDEPEGAGGSDTGPTPYEILLGALAACTCITVSMYCWHKGWSLSGITVRYTHDRVHADDCEDCEEEATGYLDRVAGDVTITGDLDETQRRRLAEVAARCPVHKTLDKGVHLVDEVAFA